MKKPANTPNDSFTTIYRELENLREDGKTETAVLRRRVAELEKALNKKDTELADATQFAKEMRLDRMKNADEALERIASMIQVEYMDYLTAVDMPMDIDLGENLRIQLKNVFRILENSGVRIK